MIHLPTLRQLQYFIAVLELRHFGRAAARMGVTQSTLSAGIQDLESRLGATLLERTKRSVMPTPLGERIAERAHQLIADAEELTRLAKWGDEPLCGPLKLGVIPTIGPFLLPRILPDIRQHYPQLQLILVEEQSSTLVEMLQGGRLDAAILAFPYPIGALHAEVFWQEDFLLALPKEHPLCDKAQVSATDLSPGDLLLLEEGHCMTDHALSACRLQGHGAEAAFQGASLYTLLQMVAGGLGVTFVPQMAVRDAQIGEKEIKLVSLQESGPHREIGMVWRSSSSRETDFQTLCTHFRQSLEQ
ncbi:hydrogen peroxide-inducible genes activator [Magnetofaba australis]|uniref:Putative transcriptional regulator of oxidative stress n=1 Tax=Magnetofaba australis IT-1 TaxID=1434232 RepID=A0A1Y2K7K4_9PROT|nr:hydrogen peroxide-inducible genes activator [Magnetofaba australis]OSM04441.1 putative transcriptional regulator of oxidative stress [Magnetofaba australis IT-1]